MFSLLGDKNKNVEAQKTAVKDDKNITTLENTESRLSMKTF